MHLMVRVEVAATTRTKLPQKVELLTNMVCKKEC